MFYATVTDGSSTQTPRKVDATAREQWTPVDPVDTKMGAVSQRPRNGALEKFPRDPLVPGYSPFGLVTRKEASTYDALAFGLRRCGFESWWGHCS